MRIWGVPLVLHYRMFLSIAVSCSCFGPYERLVLWALRRLRRAGCLYWNSVQICATLSLLHDLHAIFDPFRGPKLHESAVGILGALLSFYLFSPQYLDVSTVSWHSSASWYGWCEVSYLACPLFYLGYEAFRLQPMATSEAIAGKDPDKELVLTGWKRWATRLDDLPVVCCLLQERTHLPPKLFESPQCSSLKGGSSAAVSTVIMKEGDKPW